MFLVIVSDATELSLVLAGECEMMAVATLATVVLSFADAEGRFFSFEKEDGGGGGGDDCLYGTRVFLSRFVEAEES